MGWPVQECLEAFDEIHACGVALLRQKGFDRAG